MSIDARIVIGVTGHRKLDDPESLRPRVRRCLEEIRRALPLLKHTRYQFSVLSPLADGADRLVADELIKQPDVHLEVVLPMPREQYVRTFSAPASVVEFDTLLAEARIVRQPFGRHDAEAAYAWVGRHVVEQCDVLIAIWDGDKSAGRGGTGEIVKHARERGCPVLWIDPGKKDFLNVEWANGVGTERLRALDAYNRLADCETTERAGSGLVPAVRSAGAGLDPSALKCADAVAPYFERADQLAQFFQQRHYRAGTYIFSLAAAAVVVVATQTLFLHHHPLGGLLELFCMAGILGIIYAGKRRHWHTHWMECRYLAERLRTMIFLGACGIDVSEEARSAGAHRHEWMSMAVAAIRARLPAVNRPAEGQFHAVLEFLAREWVDDQAAYHRKRAHRCKHRHHVMEIAGVSLFFSALIACVAVLLTSIPALHHALGKSLSMAVSVLTWISICAPAVGGAIAAINNHREFRKLAHRSYETAIRLEDLSRRLRDTQSLADAGPVLTDIEEVVAGENVEWLTSVRFHSLDAPA